MIETAISLEDQLYRKSTCSLSLQGSSTEASRSSFPNGLPLAVRRSRSRFECVERGPKVRTIDIEYADGDLIVPMDMGNKALMFVRIRCLCCRMSFEYATDIFSRHFYQLREFAQSHPEAAVIFAAID